VIIQMNYYSYTLTITLVMLLELKEYLNIPHTL